MGQHRPLLGGSQVRGLFGRNAAGAQRLAPLRLGLALRPSNAGAGRSGAFSLRAAYGHAPSGGRCALGRRRHGGAKSRTHRGNAFARLPLPALGGGSRTRQRIRPSCRERKRPVRRIGRGVFLLAFAFPRHWPWKSAGRSLLCGAKGGPVRKAPWFFAACFAARPREAATRPSCLCCAARKKAQAMRWAWASFRFLCPMAGRPCPPRPRAFFLQRPRSAPS